MAKRTDSFAPLRPPSISKAEGRKRLLLLVQRGEALLAQRPLKEGQEDVWYTSCREAIEATFGEGSGHLHTLIGQVRVTVSRGGHSYDHYAEQRDAERIMRRIGVLKTLVEQIDVEIGFDAAPVTVPVFWDDIHPSISRVARPRYESGHFADSVEAAFKEINTVVKDHVKRKTGEELDGAPLMQKAFTPNHPLIVLDDLSTESGRKIQEGFMQIYAGSMIGIRNPKAHANVVIDDKRARHFLYLASLLVYRLDERL
jgi:uncharacterized protein (TIGR02391 family)